MTNFKLPVEEKARLTLESNLNSHAIHSGRTREEVIKDWTSDETGWEQLYKDELKYHQRCQKLVDQLKDQGDYAEVKGFPVFYLNTQSFNGKVKIINLNEITTPDSFLHMLRSYFVSTLCLRNVRDQMGFIHSTEQKTEALREKLEWVLRMGFDKPLHDDTKIWMSHYPDKVLEYSETDWPKLITGYYLDALGYVGGNEGYEWRFKIPPTDALACVSVFIQEDFKKTKKKIMPRKSKLKSIC